MERALLYRHPDRRYDCARQRAAPIRPPLFVSGTDAPANHADNLPSPVTGATATATITGPQ